MNLGSIKDKTSKTILRKKTVKRALGAAAVCCVAVIAVTSAVALTSGSEQVPVLENPSGTEASQSNGNAAVTKAPAATSAPKATEKPAGTVDEPASANTQVTQTMLLPVTGGNVLKGYASDTLVYSSTLKHWSTHTALDLSAPEGTSVFSALDGTVKSITDDALMGLTVTISHDNGLETVYSSLKTVPEELAEGSAVLKGQSIGTVGASAASESADGAHLHFEVFKEGVAVNPQVYLSDFLK